MAYQMLEQMKPLNFQTLKTEDLKEKLAEVGSQPKQNFFQPDDNDISKKIKERKNSVFSNQGKS